MTTSGGGEEKLGDTTEQQQHLHASGGHEKGQASISGRPFGERFGFGYFKDTFDWFTGKGRNKKDKTDGSGDGGGGAGTPTSGTVGIAGDECSSKLYLRHANMQRFVKNHHLRQIIPLPPEIDLNEWLASQFVPLYNHINLLYGTVTEFCTQSACPVMSAPNGVVYVWIDEKARKSKCSAPQYIDYVTASIEKLIKDDTVFPSKHGLPFPATFDSTTRKLLRLLFHVLVHIYHAHFDAHLALGTHVYLNGLFAHFVLFSQHFHLIEPREFDVLRDLIDALLADNDVIREATTTTTTTTSAAAGEAPGDATKAPLDVTSGGSEPVKVDESIAHTKAVCDTALRLVPVEVAVLAGSSSSAGSSRTSSPLRLPVDSVSPLKVRELIAGQGAQKEGSVI